MNANDYRNLTRRAVEDRNLVTTSFRILLLFMANGGALFMSHPQIGKALGVHEKQVGREMSKLKKLGYIEQIRYSEYRIIASQPPADKVSAA